MLRHFIKCDGHIALLKAVRDEKPEVQAWISSVIQRMEDDLMVMREVAKSMCRSFWFAVGGDKELIGNEAQTVSLTTTSPTPVKSTIAVSPLQPQATTQTVKDDESWRRSEAAHRQWFQLQSASHKKWHFAAPFLWWMFLSSVVFKWPTNIGQCLRILHRRNQHLQSQPQNL